MSLIDQLKAKSDNVAKNKQEVIEEIKKYFDEYLDSDKLENYIEKSVSQQELAERKIYMMVDYWLHHDGCSGTKIYCGGKAWHNPSRDSWEYQGVEVKEIGDEICPYLSRKLVARMKALGFTCLSEDYKTGGLGYYQASFYFGW